MQLKGITWDHDRGYAPLIKTTEEFSKIYPEISIQWDKRSLREFGDFPVSKLAQTYDLLIIDHPFTGEASQYGLYTDLKEYLSAQELQEIADQAIGHSFECYQYDGKQLAAPVDVAALVSASRDDLLERYHLTRPSKLQEVYEFAKNLPEHLKIAIPLCATDIWCVFLSLCANLSGGNFIDAHSGIDVAIGSKALDYIKRIKQISHEQSLSQNPIQILNLMATTNEIVYCPFLFGYVNYSIPSNYPYTVHFYNSPLEHDKPAPILGGAGIAISAYSKHKKEAAEYVKYVTRADIQETTYFLSGGQPSHKCAWTSQANNAVSENFFSNTYWTIENAYLRPRVPGWNRFQEDASVLINQQILEDKPSEFIVKSVNNIFKDYFLLNKFKMEV
ncbi:ABC transporter substrate-binding protein [Oscillospiraceae bacterium PP1C4]